MGIKIPTLPLTSGTEIPAIRYGVYMMTSDAVQKHLPEALDLKKRVVFQAVRVAICGNLVSTPLGETMALIGREDCLARIDRARTMAL